MSASAKRGACSASSALSAASTSRHPRYWSVLVRANTTVSTRSEMERRKDSSPWVSGLEASRTNSRAVAFAAASAARSPWIASRPPTPGVSTRSRSVSSGAGPVTAMSRGGNAPGGSVPSTHTQFRSSPRGMSTAASSP